MAKSVFSGPPSPEEFQRQLSDFVRQHFQQARGSSVPQPEPSGPHETSDTKSKAEPFAFDYKPRQVKEYLDGQDMKVRTDLKKVVRIARDSGYRGYLPIETLSKKSGEPDYDPKARAAALLKELREAIDKAA